MCNETNHSPYNIAAEIFRAKQLMDRLSNYEPNNAEIAPEQPFVDVTMRQLLADVQNDERPTSSSSAYLRANQSQLQLIYFYHPPLPPPHATETAPINQVSIKR